MTKFLSPTVARCTCRKSRTRIDLTPSHNNSSIRGVRRFHITANRHSKDYYATLGVKKNASAKDIKSAYYDKAKMYHPDANSSDNEARSRKFQEISEAYEILSDDSKRKAYDSLNRPASFSTIHDHYDQRTRAEHFRQKRRSTTPVNMHHIYQVYKTLNRAEEPEVARFRPFEDHHYPGTRYNRFEYSRFWDRERMCWIYSKKSTAGKYDQEMRRKGNLLFSCVGAFLFGSMILKFGLASMIECVKEYFAGESAGKRQFQERVDTMLELEVKK